MRSGQVGSPTRQAVMASPCASIQSSRARVPSTASPSSSPVMARITAPSGGVSRTKSTAAATKAATPDFMSVAPRPQSIPSRSTAPKGGTDHASSSPTGTTSVWPLKPKLFSAPLVPQRANRLATPPRSTRWQAKPASVSSASRSRSAPPSSGVTDGQRINPAVRWAGSSGAGDIGRPFVAVARRLARIALRCKWPRIARRCKWPRIARRCKWPCGPINLNNTGKICYH